MMQLQTIPILAGSLLLASAASADLPRSLSFEIQNGRLDNNGVVESGTDNEKEVEIGDADMDGDMDILVANGASDFGTKRNKLYLQDGFNSGTYTEVSGTAIIPEFAMADVTRNGFIRDYTGDGWNDLYVINDSNTGGFGGSDHIYVSQHPGGVFTGYSEEGLTRIPLGGALGAACGGVSFDFDGVDGPDVYSGNYPGPSQDRGLYNNGSGTFADVLANVPSDGDYTVDVASADMNGDGKIDLLISNWSSNFIYYNDNAGGSSGLGDFGYSGSTQNIGNASANENAMEAADFDSDGDQDFYWANFQTGDDDVILQNDGNDANNKATFTTLDILPASTSGDASRKASVADFNDDGKIDVFLANQSGGRPGVLRNTTVNGVISFVDWSPAPAFPANQRRGWHGAVFDSNVDGDVDILIGAFDEDHLIEGVRADETTEADLNGDLPANFWNGGGVAVIGDQNAGEGNDRYDFNASGSGFVSFVVNGPHDYRVEVHQGGVLADVNRGGVGVEEAGQVDLASGAAHVRVYVEANGECHPLDFDGNCNMNTTDLLDLLAGWGKYDTTDLLDLLANWGEIRPDYQLEVLGRTD